MLEIEIYREYDETEPKGGTPILAEQIISCEYDFALNETGVFSFQIPANDEHVSFCQDDRMLVKMYMYIYDSASDTYERRHIYDGKIRKAEIEISEDGVPVCTVSGLGYVCIMGDYISHNDFTDAADPLTTPTQLLASFANRIGVNQYYTWILDPDGEQVTRYECRINSEHNVSYLEMLSDIADDTRGCWTPLPGRKIRWINDAYIDSGLNITYLDYYDKEDLPDDVLPIKSLTLESVSDDIITGVYASAGNGTRLRDDYTPGDGLMFQMWGGIACLINRSSAIIHGTREIAVCFTDVDTYDGLKRAAANLLLNNAAPQHLYSVEVVNLKPGGIYPGESVRLDYDGVDSTGKYLSIHEDLVVISVKYSIDGDQIVTADLELSENTTKIIRDGDLISSLTAIVTDAHSIR